MPQVISRLIEERMLSTVKPDILVIGGAEDKVHGKEILHTFFESAGGESAQIAILPCASREPVITAERYYAIFTEMGAKSIEVMDIRDRNQSEDPTWLPYLSQCTGIFMTGGDQVRLCGLLADTTFLGTIRQRIKAGEIALAGTSAGAAVMGELMIAGGGSGESPNRSLVNLSMGLGFIPEVLVDQHFHNRNRMARLMSAIATHPDRMGIGIDEDTCAMFSRNGTFKVIGKGTVTVINALQIRTNHAQADASEPLCLHNLTVHVLVHGDRYDMHQNRLLAAPLMPD
jgi:cyanophycinase